MEKLIELLLYVQVNHFMPCRKESVLGGSCMVLSYEKRCSVQEHNTMPQLTLEHVNFSGSQVVNYTTEQGHVSLLFETAKDFYYTTTKNSNNKLPSIPKCDE